MSTPSFSNSPCGPALPVAAVVQSASMYGADALMAQFARDLLARGLRICGLIQAGASHGGCDADEGQQPALVDLDNGSRYRLFQELGAGSRSCRVDPEALADASGVLREALALQPDLVIINRFGSLEAAGKGFADEMLALMSEGIPLLTVVADKHLADWRRFTGGAATELPPRHAAVRAWFEQIHESGKRPSE